MTNSNSKGARGERELRNRMGEYNWMVVKVPTSGSATPLDLPDIIAAQGKGNAVATEAKRASDDPVYVDAEKLSGLVRFAFGFGATPVVSARWDGDTTWYHAHVHSLPRTDSGNASFNPKHRDAEWVVTTPDLFDFIDGLGERTYCPTCGEALTSTARAAPDVALDHGYLTLCKDCADELDD